jgi:hypothetical protein
MADQGVVDDTEYPHKNSVVRTDCALAGRVRRCLREDMPLTPTW